MLSLNFLLLFLYFIFFIKSIGVYIVLYLSFTILAIPFIFLFSVTISPMGSVLLCMKDAPTAILYFHVREDMCFGHRCFVLNNSCIGKTNFIIKSSISWLRKISDDSECRRCSDCGCSFRILVFGKKKNCNL